MKIKKHSFTIPISAEELFDMRAERFPRRCHEVEHPVTAEQQTDYAAWVQQYKAAVEAGESLSTVGVRHGWLRPEGGYDYEPAEIQPLKPRIEYVYDETVTDHRARVERIYAHYADTGEWLEKPMATFSELMDGMLSRAFAGPESL